MNFTRIFKHFQSSKVLSSYSYQQIIFDLPQITKLLYPRHWTVYSFEYIFTLRQLGIIHVAVHGISTISDILSLCFPVKWKFQSDSDESLSLRYLFPYIMPWVPSSTHSNWVVDLHVFASRIVPAIIIFHNFLYNPIPFFWFCQGEIPKKRRRELVKIPFDTKTYANR